MLAGLGFQCRLRSGSCVESVWSRCPKRRESSNASEPAYVAATGVELLDIVYAVLLLLLALP